MTEYSETKKSNADKIRYLKKVYEMTGSPDKLAIIQEMEGIVANLKQKSEESKMIAY